mgnify:CR=1 FL=1
MNAINESTGLAKFEYSRLFSRERVLTSLAGRLTKSRRVLWYLETLVLSARYFQRISSSDFGSDRYGIRFSHREKLWQDAVVPYLAARTSKIQVAEFGVAYGRATAWWHQNLDNISRWDGFDTFEGLPTPWTRGGVTVMNQGVFAPTDSADPFPHIKGATNITWHKGLIRDTISELSRSEGSTLFVLIDVDLLEPTRDILQWMEVNGRPGDCIYFDEAFDPFNEGLALNESISRGFKFEVLGYTGSALCIVLV